MLGLIRHLPDDSAFQRRLTGDWSTLDELTAAGLEIAHAQYRATLAAAGMKRGRLPKPLHLPRPTPWAPPTTTPTTTRPPQRGRRRASTVAEVVAVVSRGFGPATRG